MIFKWFAMVVVLSAFLQKTLCIETNSTIVGGSLNSPATSNLTAFWRVSTSAEKLTTGGPVLQKTTRKANNTQKLTFNYWDASEILLDTVLFIVGVMGNTLIIVTVYKNKNLHNLQNYFVANLAVADLVTLLVLLPILLCAQYVSWPFGKFTCYYVIPFADCIPAVSILTLVVVSCDRYRIIICSIPRSLSNNAGGLVILLIWIVSYVVIGLPLSFVMTVKHHQDRDYCYALWQNTTAKHAYYLSRVAVLYLAPSIAIFYCFIHVRKVLRLNIANLSSSISGSTQIKWVKHQRKIMRVFFIIFVVFVLCFLPFNLINFLYLYSADFSTWKHNGKARQVGNVFVFLNSTCNPIILYVLSRTFRRYFQTLFPCLARFNKKRRVSLFDYGDFEDFPQHPEASERKLSLYERFKRRRSTNNTILEFDMSARRRSSAVTSSYASPNFRKTSATKRISVTNTNNRTCLNRKISRTKSKDSRCLITDENRNKINAQIEEEV